MKIIRQANGKTALKISRKEWEGYGRKAGWLTAQYSDSGLPDDTDISPKDDVSRKMQNDMYMSILHDIQGQLDHNSLLELEERLQVLSSWIAERMQAKKEPHINMYDMGQGQGLNV